MAFVRTKKIKKKGATYEYRYLETRWREGKKVRSHSTYLGTIAFGLFTLGALFVRKKLEGDYREHVEKRPVDPALRDRQIAQAQVRDIERRYGLDSTSEDTFAVGRARMSPEVWAEYNAELEVVARSFHQSASERAQAKSPSYSKTFGDEGYGHQGPGKVDSAFKAEMAAFNERMKATKEKQDTAIAARADAEKEVADEPDAATDKAPSEPGTNSAEAETL